MGAGEINAWNLFQLGGPMMWPLTFCSFFALAIIIEKIWRFSLINTNTVHLRNQILQLVRNNKIKEAIDICDENLSPTAKMLRAGVMKFGATRDEITEAMEEISVLEIPQLEKRLTALITIANISPLLGLLGTVIGMCLCFRSIQIQSTSVHALNLGDLAGGIWQALLTTVAGLIVAIPSYLAYNYFVNRVNSFVLEMEQAATELVNVLCHLTETSLAKGD